MVGPEVTPEMVEAFKAAWLKADAEGRTGERVARGLMAALTAAPSPASEARVGVVWAVEYSKKGLLGFFTEWIDFGDYEAGARRVAARELDGKLLRRTISDWVEVTNDE